MSVAAALLAIGRGDFDEARSMARRAREHERAVGHALWSYLEGVPGSGVYGEPTAFRGFIDGGGNVALYEHVNALVATARRRHRPAALLDIGCGDGRVTEAAAGGSVTSIDLVEPSEELLATARRRLVDAGVDANPHHTTVEAFVTDSHEAGPWDLALSTFALHNLAPEPRVSVLRWLAGRCSRLLVAEFDVPDFEDGSPQHAAYAAKRYERGVAEYGALPEVIAGFLMPVLVGQFDPAAPRHTYEQSARRWGEQLADAGWRVVTNEVVHDYWWAPAIVIEAVPARVR